MADDEPAAKVTLRAEKDIWTFAAGDRVVTLDWTTGEAGIRR
jgi:hypothetical protein